MVKSPPVMQKTQVQSLGQEDPLEKEMAIHSSILAWRIPWKEMPGRLQSMGSQRVRHYWVTFTSEKPGVLQVVRLQRDRNNLVIVHQQQPHCIGYWAKSFSWLHHLILFTFPRGEYCSYFCFRCESQDSGKLTNLLKVPQPIDIGARI